MNEKSLSLFTSAVIKSVTDVAERILYAKISDEVIDRDNEIIRLSAWSDNQLDEFLKNSGALLLSHDYHSLPIGKILRFDRRPDGLFMEAQLIKGTSASEEAWTVISQIGKIGFSVGFKPKRSEEIQVDRLLPREKDSAINAGFGLRDKIRVYTSVELLELSLVSIPSLQSATLISYKSGQLGDHDLNEACRLVYDDSGHQVALDSMQKILDEAIGKAITGEKIGDLITVSLDRLREKVKDEDDEEPEIIIEEDEEYITKEQMGAMVKKACDRVLNPETLRIMIQDAISLAVDKARGVVR